MKSFFLKLSKIGRNVGRFLTRASEVEQALSAMTPEAKAAALETFSDVLAFVAAVDAAVEAKGTNFALDGKVLAYAKELYDDAKRDVAEAKKIFAALGIDVPAEKAAA